MLEPAKKVIELCGGLSRVAQITKRSTLSVRRWGYTKEKKGSDGFVPAHLAQKLLDHSRANGGKLRPHHFFLGGK